MNYHPLWKGTSATKKHQEHTFTVEHPHSGPVHVLYEHVSSDGSPAYLNGIEFDLPEGQRFNLGSDRWLIHGDSFQATTQFYPPLQPRRSSV